MDLARLFRQEDEMDDPRSLNSNLKQGHGAVMLNLMPSLESLTVQPSIENGENILSTDLHLRDFIGLMPASPLQNIKLKFAEAHEDAIVDFFVAHSKTLKNITLLSCGLWTGSMKSLCKQLQQSLSIDTFCLLTGSLEYHGGEDRETDYILWDYNNRLDPTWVLEWAATKALEDFVTGCHITHRFRVTVFSVPLLFLVGKMESVYMMLPYSGPASTSFQYELELHSKVQ